jgi:FtsP/CotA-like multicopper oxidase with cupredoxin domain
LDADEMDAMHEKGVKYFLDNIGKDKDFWGVDMPFTMDGDTKVFEVTCTEAPWEVAPGQTINAMLYNGRVPGQIMRVTQGENVRVNVTNKMSQSTAIHFHGVHTPNSMDGVPFITQPPIKPNSTFTYEFRAKNAGTHLYHSHHNAAEQVTRGLFGAFIIEPTDKSKEPQVAGDYIMVLNDAGIGMSINGKSFPATQPILANKGDRIRIRYMNEGLQIHPMHLHGMYQTVIAKDGATLSIPYLADTLNVAPGERYDVLVDCEEPGAWAFHCHILSHAESAHGMFGMVTALVIK